MTLTSLFILTLVLQEGAAAPESKAPEIRVRIGDMTDIQGVRSNQLHGLGFVIGLSGTGDQANATKQALANYFKGHQLNVSAADVNAGNVALVTVTATLEPFKANGARIDVTVSAMEAKSLVGGTLLQTELKGADGQVYAMAQGAVSLGGGYQAIGAAASATKGHLTVGTVPNGALIEREVPMQMISEGGLVKLDLKNADFTTSKRISEAINHAYPSIAKAINKGEVWVRVPEDIQLGGELVAFLSSISEIEVVPDSQAIIVFNEKTGTLVSGEHVRISPAAVAHGSLTISITENPEVSQPAPLSGGREVVVPRTEIKVDQKTLAAQMFSGAVDVATLVKGLNAINTTPRDLIAILQALKRAGALHAELVIM